MTEEARLIVKIVSTFFILIPIILAWMVQEKAGKTFRLFTFFLALGFLADFVGFWHYLVSPIPDFFIENKLHFYILVEGMFFLWFLSNLDKIRRAYRSSLLILTCVVWLVLIVLIPDRIHISTPVNLFELVYQIIAIFLGSKILLQFIEEKETPIKQPHFWLVLGVFFYCLSTLLIALLKDTLYEQPVWPIHNFLNMTTYILYSIGFFQEIKRQKPASTSTG